MTAQYSYRDQSPLTSIDRSYSIRKQRSQHRYRITVPRDILDIMGVESGDSLGVWICPSEEGYLQIAYETDLSGCHLTSSVSKHSSGELTIPSSVGASARLGENGLSWELYEKEDEEYLLLGTTTHKLVKHTTSGSTFIGCKELKHVKQEVTHEGKTWNQEHFQVYLDKQATEIVHWGSPEILGIVIASIDGEIGLKFTRSESQVPEKARKKAQVTGDEQKDRITYAPNGLVRTLKFVDLPVNMFATSAGSLLINPQSATQGTDDEQED